MPEVAIDKDNYPILSKDEVWPTNEVLRVGLPFESAVRKCFRDSELWAGVLAFDARHQCTTLCRGHDIAQIPDSAHPAFGRISTTTAR